MYIGADGGDFTVYVVYGNTDKTAVNILNYMELYSISNEVENSGSAKVMSIVGVVACLLVMLMWNYGM